MRKSSVLLAGVAGLALAAGFPLSSQAQEGPGVKSWGTKTTTYFSTPATGNPEPNKEFNVGQPTMPSTPAVQPAATQNMYYQPPARRIKAKGTVHRANVRPMPRQGMRPKQGQGQPEGQPPNATPGAPPSTQPGTPPSAQPGEGTQPGQPGQGQGTQPK